MVKIDQEKEEIYSFFYSVNVRQLTYQIGEEYYRDLNLFFVYDEDAPRRRQRWHTTNPSFFTEAICAKVTNQNFNEKEFAKRYYQDDKKGDKVIGTYSQRLRLGNKNYLMPIHYVFRLLQIQPNEPFFTSNTLHLKTNTFLKEDAIKDLGAVFLTDYDIQQIRTLIPNFRLKHLHKFVKVKSGPSNWQNEILFYPLTSYKHFGQPEYTASNFQVLSNNTLKYSRYLGTD